MGTHSMSCDLTHKGNSLITSITGCCIQKHCAEAVENTAHGARSDWQAGLLSSNRPPEQDMHEEKILALGSQKLGQGLRLSP